MVIFVSLVQRAALAHTIDYRRIAVAPDEVEMKNLSWLLYIGRSSKKVSGDIGDFGKSCFLGSPCAYH